MGVVEEDFISAKSELVPSVSMDELQHYERVRATFEGAAKKVETNGEKVRSIQEGDGSECADIFQVSPTCY